MYYAVIVVSIHAPARGATDGSARLEDDVAKIVSTTARAGRDRPLGTTIPTGASGFNPRARAGRDTSSSLASSALPSDVSIHAPARGATRQSWPKSRRLDRFNPRARAGRDTVQVDATSSAAHVSIHAPARGATDLLTLQLVRHYSVSIHAPARGATTMFASSCAASSAVSIHAPARGATLRSQLRLLAARAFQSTRPRGARRHVARA